MEQTAAEKRYITRTAATYESRSATLAKIPCDSSRLRAVVWATVKIRLVTATPLIDPRFFIALIMPDAIPILFGGTAPMIALLFGGWNNPIPIPNGTSLNTTPSGVVPLVSVLRKASPRQLISAPVVLILRIPSLSAR